MAVSGYTVRIVYNFLPAINAKVMDDLDDLIGRTALKIAGEAIMLAPVDTGFLKNSIDAYAVGFQHWVVVVMAHYGLYVEEGTVNMGAQPYVRPAAAIGFAELEDALGSLLP